MIAQKITLIINRKSTIAFPNLRIYLTCGATWWRSRHYVTSDIMGKLAIIAYNLETVRERENVYVNHKYEVSIIYDL